MGRGKACFSIMLLTRLKRLSVRHLVWESTGSYASATGMQADLIVLTVLDMVVVGGTCAGSGEGMHTFTGIPESPPFFCLRWFI